MKLFGLIATVTACYAHPVHALQRDIEKPDPEACPYIGNLEPLYNNGARIIIVGDTRHGTVELPDVFFQILCSTLRHNKKIVVGLEIDENNQSSLDKYISSEGLSEDKKSLILTEFWSETPDGRTSESMFNLIDRLRLLKKAGHEVTVKAFNPYRPGPREKNMGSIWRSYISDNPDSIVLVYAGTYHMRIPEDGSLLSAASHLNDIGGITLELTHDEGEAWVCRETDCGVFDVPALDGDRSRPFVDLGKIGNWHRYSYYIGTGINASTPANPQAIDHIDAIFGRK